MMNRASLRALIGILLSLGAPIGWTAISYLIHPQKAHFDPLLLAYMTIGTAIAFGTFGFILGKKEQLLVKQSLRDHITGAYNARFFQQRLDQEFAQSTRSNTPLCIVTFDIDHFKSINDRFGHPSGDRVLKELVQTVSYAIRAGDTMARMGGEEFAVLLPNSSEVVGQSFSERLRSTVESMTILLPGHDPVSLTISLGYACTVSFPDLGPLDLYELADKALYAAKEQGRNQTVGAKEIRDAVDMHTLQNTPDTSS